MSTTPAPALSWPHHWLAGGSRRSLRRRLLLFLLLPLMMLLVAGAAVTYLGALAYSNRIHDRNLVDSAMALAQLLNQLPAGEKLTAQARFLLEYDPDGRNYFSIRSMRHGITTGSDGLAPATHPPQLDRGAVLYDTVFLDRKIRVAALVMPNRYEPSDLLTVSVAETLEDRRRQAREILLLAIPTQTALILAMFALVWFGVNHGLRELQPLTERLARREHDLAPITDADVPEEVQPLTRTIDGLFGRLRSMLNLQERFIADAAHQLRTPLAGLRVHADRLQRPQTPEETADAIGQIQRLVERASRSTSQLLALTRAQSTQVHDLADQTIDLATLIPELVSLRVQEAIAAGIDLGYEGLSQPTWIHGSPTQLQELLDNLIDNGLRYAGRGSMVTVRLSQAAGEILLSVEDNGPGVPSAYLNQLGERFFRVPGGGGEGSGLGLAIAQRIAEYHGAALRYHSGSEGGLVVELRFPASPAEPA